MTKLGEYCSWDETNGTAVVALAKELGSLDWQEFGELTDEVVGCLRAKGAKDIVVDLSNTQIMGSETIGFLIRLRGLAVTNGGRMALCGLSQIEWETLRAMRLEEQFWHVCSRRCNPTPEQCAECPEFVASCVCDN